MFNPFISPFRQFDFTQPGTDTAVEPTFEDAYRELLERKNGPAMSSYRRFLEEAPPDPSQHRLGTTGKIGAMLSGVAAGFRNPSEGARLVTELARAPYEQALDRYDKRGKSLERAANVERLAFEDDVQRAKTVFDIENKKAKALRDDRLANSLINLRTENVKNIRDMIDKRGMFHETDAETGVLYIIKADGTRQPVGKFDLTTGQRIDNEKDLAKYRSTLSYLNSSKLQEDRQRFTSSEREAGQAYSTESREDTQSHQETMLGRRQNFSREERIKRQEAQLEYLKQRVHLTGKEANQQSTNQRIKENVWMVDGVVSQDPDRFADVWIVGPNGYKELNPEKANTPEYKELHALLYRGFMPKVTKSGNERIK